MFKIIVLFALTALCQADPPVTPPPVKCGMIPDKILKCIGNPNLVTRDVAAQCARNNDCERVKCIFDKSGWMDGAAVNKAKLTAYFDQFAKDHPAWAMAVNHIKTTCLATDLPSQGMYLNCPPYDIIHCALTGFFRNVQPSQWSTAEECVYPRQYAAVCPICPEDCFAPAIPYGSCNACRLLPQQVPQTP